MTAQDTGATPRTPFPPGWTGIRRRLWRLLPLGVRSRWSPYDNWLRGYSAGWAAATNHDQGEEADQRRIADLEKGLQRLAYRAEAALDCYYGGLEAGCDHRGPVMETVSEARSLLNEKPQP